jgi:uncharacterized protein
MQTSTERDTPMTFEEIIQDFGTSETVPVEAIQAALAAPAVFLDQAIPLLDRIAQGASDEHEDRALVMLVVMLGEIGDERAFQPLMRVLRLPTEEIDVLFGDVLIDTLGRVVISLAGSHAPLLERALHDTSYDDFVRAALFDAWTGLALAGKVSRDKARAFLSDYPVKAELDAGDFGWTSWLDAVTLLGLAEIRDFAREHLPHEAGEVSLLNIPMDTFEDFERELSATQADPDRWKRELRFQPFTNTIAELKDWPTFKYRPTTFEEIIESLAQSETVPVDAVKAALAAPAAFVDQAIALMDRVATAAATEDEEDAFAGLVLVLGEIGDERALQPFMRVLALPIDRLNPLLGGMITESLDSVLMRLAGNQAAALEDALSNTAIDEFVRNAIFEAWTYFVLTGRVSREEARAFLSEYPSRLDLDSTDYGWVSWVYAATALGFAEMRDFASRHLPPDTDALLDADAPEITLRDFDRMLADTKADPEAWKDGTTYLPLTSAIDELSKWNRYSEEYRGKREFAGATDDEDDWLFDDEEDPVFDEPYVASNPYKNVGRNDPCPCGSGKKFKKCCLNKDGLIAD